MAKTLATVFGVIFVLVGLLGFIQNPIVGSGALFEADIMHNLAHLVIGILLLIIAFASPANSSMGLKVFGVIYLLLAILGFVMVPEGGSLLGLISTNTADHWLHIVLGVVLVAAGFWVKDAPMAMNSQPMGGGQM